MTTAKHTAGPIRESDPRLRLVLTDSDGTVIDSWDSTNDDGAGIIYTIGETLGMGSTGDLIRKATEWWAEA